jgi:hypothetical protein
MSQSRSYSPRLISCLLAFSLGLLACAAEGSKKRVPLTAAIEVPAGQNDPRNYQIELRITNTSDRKVAVLNPDVGVPTPAMKWPFSQQVYQISTLFSFGYLSISVRDENGGAIPAESISAWATPALKPPLELKPGDSIELTIPLGALYRLPSGKKCHVTIQYGDQNQKVEALGAVMAP